MTDTPRETRVLDAVVSLVDSLLDDFDVVDLLTELTERCAELLDIEAAGFLLADPLEQLRLLAATSEQAHELELFQLQADEGPCVDCYATGQPVSVPPNTGWIAGQNSGSLQRIEGSAQRGLARLI